MLCFLLLLVLVLLVSAVGGFSLRNLLDTPKSGNCIARVYSESCCANSAKELPSDFIVASKEYDTMFVNGHHAGIANTRMHMFEHDVFQPNSGIAKKLQL